MDSGAGAHELNGFRAFPTDIGKMSDDIGRVSDDIWKMSDDILHMSDDIWRMSDGTACGAFGPHRMSDDIQRVLSDTWCAPSEMSCMSAESLRYWEIVFAFRGESTGSALAQESDLARGRRVLLRVG